MLLLLPASTIPINLMLINCFLSHQKQILEPNDINAVQQIRSSFSLQPVHSSTHHSPLLSLSDCRQLIAVYNHNTQPSCRLQPTRHTQFKQRLGFQQQPHSPAARCPSVVFIEADFIFVYFHCTLHRPWRLGAHLSSLKFPVSSSVFARRGL